METMQTEAQRAKRQNQQSLSGQGTISIRILSKGERRKQKNYLKKHWQNFFANLMKTMNLHIQGAQRHPKQDKQRKPNILQYNF